MKFGRFVPTTSRPTGRIVVLDQDGRVLLFSFRPRGDGDGHGSVAKRCWFTPGGGARRGETPAATASRELREETGLIIEAAAMGPVVAQTSGVWTASNGRRFRGHDSFFCVRVQSPEIDMSGLEDFERGAITGHRWWGAAELDSTHEIVYPSGLAGLVRRLVTGERVSSPLCLPWAGE